MCTENEPFELRHLALADTVPNVALNGDKHGTGRTPTPDGSLGRAPVVPPCDWPIRQQGRRHHHGIPARRNATDLRLILGDIAVRQPRNPRSFKNNMPWDSRTYSSPTGEIALRLRR